MCRDFLTNLDTFGAPIGMTVNREPVFKTAIGGFTALLFSIIFGSILVQQIIQNFVNTPYTS